MRAAPAVEPRDIGLSIVTPKAGWFSSSTFRMRKIRLMRLGILLAPMLAMAFTTLHPPRAAVQSSMRTTLPPRAAVQAKITGAALAAAFAAKNEDGPPAKELSLAEKEELVIQTIRDGLEAGSDAAPKRVFEALGEFGKASGTLAQTWLTPQSLERCAFFWGGGCALLARDLRRGKLGLADLKATPGFLLLSANTFPWTPLLVPLVSRAINSTEGSSSEASFVPKPFREERLASLQRLRRDYGLTDVTTPQNIDEGVRFFSDGGRMLIRDVARGRLYAYGDRASAYGWFAFLSLSTFPLTPLLIPVIDKRRNGEGAQQAQYVPSSFRAQRLASFARLRSTQDAKAAADMRSPVDAVRAAALSAAAVAVVEHDGDAQSTENLDGHVERPAPAEVLAAIAALSRSPSNGREASLEALAGGGSPGRRWQLIYVAGKDALMTARKQQQQQQRKQQQHEGQPQQRESTFRAPPSWTDELGEALLPWTRLKHGLYVDGYVSAIQRFDGSRHENENGVFGVMGQEWLRFTVKGPFKWPEAERGRSICAFQPTLARCELGPLGWDIPMAPVALQAERTQASTTSRPAQPAAQQQPVEHLSFEATPVTKLPFFKFLHVDDAVAVAQGRSGSVAVWARIE